MSAPAPNSSSACLGVIPIPPEAFSPLTITKSAPSSSRRPRSMVRATRRPASRRRRRRRGSRSRRHGSRPPARGAYWRRCRRHDRPARRGGGPPGGTPSGASPAPPRTSRRAGGRAGGRAALDPARRPPARDPRRLGAAAGGGPDHAPVRRRGADRAAAQPLRGAPAARRRAARVRRADRLRCSSSALAGLGVAVAGPIGDQASTFGRNVPGIVATPTAELANVQHWLDRNGINVEIQKQGRTALQTLGDRVSAGSGELVSLHARRADDPDRGARSP